MARKSRRRSRKGRCGKLLARNFWRPPASCVCSGRIARLFLPKLSRLSQNSRPVASSRARVTRHALREREREENVTALLERICLVFRILPIFKNNFYGVQARDIHAPAPHSFLASLEILNLFEPEGGFAKVVTLNSNRYSKYQ